MFVPAGVLGNHFQKVPVPPEFNYDFWLGQAPTAEYFTERCHGSFRWWWDYAGGPVTDWGAHHNDIARWGIGLDGPSAVEARVITPPLPDGYTTPSEYEATLAWANGVTHIVKTTTDEEPSGAVINPNGQRNGVKFTGTNGWIWVNRDGISASDKELLLKPLPDNAVRLEVSNDHMGNFFDCVRSRKDPVANIETGHRSASIVPSHRHRTLDGAKIAVGSGEGNFHRRRRGGGEPPYCPCNAETFRLQLWSWSV